MDKESLLSLLDRYKAGELAQDEALAELERLPFEDLGFAKVDHHRAIRNGYPEVIYCPGKSNAQIAAIAERLLSAQSIGLLASRATPENYEALRAVAPDAVYHPEARLIVVSRTPLPKRGGTVCVVAAGTADYPVAEEAALTADAMGNTVERVYDVGVAGIHRLFARLDTIRAASVVICVAGMEGALVSVVGGLTKNPVVAVPTSVGYGASFQGLAALLAMLNSCASGVGVVNIDNGFGAACLASRINHLG